MLHSKFVWRSFVIKKIKNTALWTYVISDFNGEEIVGTFYEKELQKTNQTEFRVDKVIKKKVIKYMPNGKTILIHLMVGSIRKMFLKKIPSYKMSHIFLSRVNLLKET